ncbi:MAG: hypothetical protein HY308_13010 [Gammaproteobacteria bacterium]|nr:hypothetical protein [Gammaproteobacteria bacterium]
MIDYARTCLLVVAAVGLLGGSPAVLAFGKDKPRQNYSEPAEVIWQELAEVAIPAYPDASNLAQVPVEKSAGIAIDIDRTSVSLGQDGVVRFAVVVQSARGARNVFYEGMRCGSAQYKIYAIGTSEQKFRAVQNPRWAPIAEEGPNAFRDLLRDYHICHRGSPRSPQEILRSLTARDRE